MAALNSSTGHTHSGSGNNGPRLASSAVTTTFGNGFTTVTGASSDYLLIASDASDSNTTKKALASDFIFVPSAANAIAGSVVQTVNVINKTMAENLDAIPADNSIPQVTEGTEVMTLAITPTSASNKLKITVVVQIGSASAGSMAAALFNADITATDAIATGCGSLAAAGSIVTITIVYYVTAPGTSSTTFKVRAGSTSTDADFNGSNGATKYGNPTSSITIEEIKV
jgi:hypothetical protein